MITKTRCWSSIHSFLLLSSISSQLLPRSLEPLLQHNCDPVRLKSPGAVLRLHLLVQFEQIQHVGLALAVDNGHITQVLVKFYIDHCLSDFSLELARVDIDFHFCVLISPRKLGNSYCLGFGHIDHFGLRRLLRGFSFDQHGVSAVDFTIAFEVLSAFLSETFRCVSVVVLDKKAG